MSCLKPNVISQRVDPETGRVVSHFEGPLPEGVNPINFEMSPLTLLDWHKIRRVLVPCNSCIGCRSDRTKTWTDRLAIEYLDNGCKAIFLTLTYDNDHLPKTPNGYGTVCIRDIQLFLKRFRKYFTGRRIRYYCAAEYGSRNTHRPHYHLIIFGVDLSDFTGNCIIGTNDRGDAHYSNPTLVNLWKNGHIVVSGCTYHTFAYTARYTLKKLLTVERKRQSEFDMCSEAVYYDEKLGRYVDTFSHFRDDRCPEFSVMSRRPGIGFLNSARYAMIWPKRTVVMQDQTEPVEIYVPRVVVKHGLKRPDIPSNIVSSVLEDMRRQDDSKDILKGYDTYFARLQAEKDRYNKYLKLRSDIFGISQKQTI